jgi:hypothetical protein
MRLSGGVATPPAAHLVRLGDRCRAQTTLHDKPDLRASPPKATTPQVCVPSQPCRRRQEEGRAPARDALLLRHRGRDSFRDSGMGASSGTTRARLSPQPDMQLRGKGERAGFLATAKFGSEQETDISYVIGECTDVRASIEHTCSALTASRDRSRRRRAGAWPVGAQLRGGHVPAIARSDRVIQRYDAPRRARV